MDEEASQAILAQLHILCIQNQKHLIHPQFGPLLQSNKEDVCSLFGACLIQKEIRIMYGLLSLVPGGVDELKQSFQDYILHDINEQFKKIQQTVKTEPQQFVNIIFHSRLKFIQMIKKLFQVGQQCFLG